MKQGLFIAFEGIDGSGKSTQAKLLAKKLRQRGYPVELIDFPQHGTASSGQIDKYLRGEYGDLKSVTPYQASIFFACDRYDAGFKIRKWLALGKIVIADRYLGSNIGHQGGRIRSKRERKRYLKWLFNLEYGIFKVPKPDINLLFDLPIEIAVKLIRNIRDKDKLRKKKNYLHGKKDIHEKSLSHLKMARQAYLETARFYPHLFKLIPCYANGRLLNQEEIGQIVWKELGRFFQ